MSAHDSVRDRALDLGLFGCPLDTGNLGVSALGISTIHGLVESGRDVSITLYDYGRGERRSDLRIADRSVPIKQVGCAYSRRYYRLGNLQQLSFAARLGLARIHPVLRAMSRHDALLDISGGDSFSDIYGDWRFRSVVAPKHLALALGVPLVLLPQTYGPWEGATAREESGEILRRAHQVWARDARSLEIARSGLGDAFDPQRHRCGVDVAFGLPVQAPSDSPLIEGVSAFRGDDGLLLGLNVSGLLYNQPGEDQSHFKMRAPYREIVHRIAQALLDQPNSRLLLISHVVSPCHAQENDRRACLAVAEHLGPDFASRVFVAPELAHPSEMKWLVGQCDWFSGTRMHACIAGLSQGVPTASLAYSDKSLGVFETAGAGDWVIDPRKLELDEVIAGITASVSEREAARASIARSRGAVAESLASQFESILAIAGD